MKTNIIVLLITVSLLLGGCATVASWKDAAALKAGYVSKNKFEGLLAQTKKEYEQKLIDAQLDIDKKNQIFINGLNDKMQFAANKLYGADFAFQLNLTPDRTHLVMDNRVNEARAVLPSADTKAVIEENEKIKKELNETLTSLSDLKKSHDETLVKAKTLNEEVTKKQEELEAAKKEKDAIKTEGEKKADAIQQQLNKANDVIITDERKRGDDAKAIQAAKEKLSLGAGILAALCIAGAIWSPVMKDKCAMAAIVFGIGAVGIWYLTPIVVFSIVGIAILFVVGIVIYQHNKDNKAAIATYSALEELKTKSGDVWDKEIAPVLSSWQTKYVKKQGKIIEVSDPSISNHIDAKLASVGVLSAEKPKE